MILYLIQADVSIRVFGISGPFQQYVSKLVRAHNVIEAKAKYEQHVRSMFAHMQGEEFSFSYKIIADEI